MHYMPLVITLVYLAKKNHIGIAKRVSRLGIP